MGRTANIWSPGPMSAMELFDMTTKQMFRWDSMTPLAMPEVPEV